MITCGFIILGDVYQIPLLKIVSYILIFHEIFNTSYRIVSVYQPEISSEYIDGAIAMTIGAILIVYGFSLSKLKKQLGRVANAAAFFSFIAGFFLLIVALWFWV